VELSGAVCPVGASKTLVECATASFGARLEAASRKTISRHGASEVNVVGFGFLSRWAQEVGGHCRYLEEVIRMPRRDDEG
jgi:hypothetical protein